MHASRLIGAGALVAAASLASASSGSAQPAPLCHARQLQLLAGFQGAALGSFTQTFTFVNASRRQCRLSGWPTLELGKTRRVVQDTPPAPAFTTVTLAPRGAASFDVYGEDWNHAANRACPATATVRIAPPGDRSTLSVRVKMPNCRLFYVAPLIPGRTDRRAWSVVWHP
jgi:hypothetical protein